MKDRFDLEEAIQHVWATVEDIRTVNEMMYDSDLVWNDDKRWNAMEGLAAVMECKGEKLWNIFKQVHELDEYSEMREVLAKLSAKEYGDEEYYD